MKIQSRIYFGIFFFVGIMFSIYGCKSSNTGILNENSPISQFEQTSTISLTITPFPTATLLPTPTPIGGVSHLLIACDYDGPPYTGYFEYNIPTNNFKHLSDFVFDKKEYLRMMFQLRGLSEEQAQNIINQMPKEFVEVVGWEQWQESSGDILLGFTIDRKIAILEHFGPKIFDPKYIYWLSTDGETKTLYNFTNPAKASDIQEIVYNPKYEMVAITFYDGARNLILLINLKEGTLLDLAPNSTKINMPYRVNFTPDFESITYSDKQGTWICPFTGENCKLLIENGFDADISPDGNQIVYETKYAGQGDLWISNIDGTNPTPLINSEDNSPIQGESPQWVPNVEKSQIVYTNTVIEKINEKRRWSESYELYDLNKKTNTTIKPSELYALKGFGQVFTWSPDGLWFLGNLISYEGEWMNQFPSSYICSIESQSCTLLDSNGDAPSGRCYSQISDFLP
jgi:hypothetical protein